MPTLSNDPSSMATDAPPSTNAVLPSAVMLPPSIRMPKLFSAPSLPFLIVGVIVFFIAVQQLGVYLFAPIVLDDVLDDKLGNALTAAQWLSLGVDNGSVISYTMLLIWLLMSVAIVGLIKARIHWIGRTATGRKSKTAHRLTPKQVATQHRYSVRNYLALKPFSVRVAVALIGLWLVYCGISNTLIYWLNKNPTEFMDVLYNSAQPKWLLIVVIVMVVPCYEELMFRGLFWSALSEQLAGQRGVWLASIVTSTLFALIHLQYDLFEMSLIFCLAMLMSYARYQSGSLWLPILMHIINNGVAMGEYLLFK